MSLEHRSPYYDDRNYSAEELEGFSRRSLEDSRMFVSGEPVMSAAGTPLDSGVARVIYEQSIDAADFMHNRAEQKRVQDPTMTRRQEFDHGVQNHPWN